MGKNTTCLKRRSKRAAKVATPIDGFPWWHHSRLEDRSNFPLGTSPCHPLLPLSSLSHFLNPFPRDNSPAVSSSRYLGANFPHGLCSCGFNFSLLFDSEPILDPFFSFFFSQIYIFFSLFFSFFQLLEFRDCSTRPALSAMKMHFVFRSGILSYPSLSFLFLSFSFLFFSPTCFFRVFFPA